jgi:UDP-2,3-diacylglucosamine pyrophosphatase LpxH
MKLDDVHAWFAAQKLPFSWLTQTVPGKRFFQKVRPPAGSTLDIAPLEAAIIVPDVHLGTGNDVFRFNEPERAARLEHFFDTLGVLRNQLQGKLDIVQLGDWYDFWRVGKLTSVAAKTAIEAQYGGIVSRARDLGVRHCVGNHDAGLVEAACRAGIDVEIVRTLGASHNVLCFHGHDTETLASVAVDGTAETLGLSILNLVNSAPLIGIVSSIIQRVIDNSSADPWSDNPKSLPWPNAKVQGPAGWAAPWTARDDATQLGAAISGFELCTKQPVQVVIVGHTHRPGISWSPVAGRRVPIVDAGSWTYGRAEFAVVCADGIGVAALD